MRKNNLLIFIGLFLTFILVACSTDNESTSKATNNAESEYSQGVTENEILIGHTGPQSGPVAAYDVFRKGMDAYFNYVNENGGVHGRQIKLIAYDDQFQPAKATQFAKRLVENDKVFLVAGNQGSANNQATKDFYLEKGIPVIMPGVGIESFVNPPKKNWFGSNMVNYELEAKVLLDYAVNELGAKKIVIAYQNDDLGKAAFTAVQQEIKSYEGIELVGDVTYLPADTEFSSQAQKISDLAPDTVFSFGIMNPSVNLKKALYKIGLEDINYFVPSISGGDALAFDLAGPDVWEGTYSGGVRISLDKTDNEHVKLFIDEFKKSYPNEKLGDSAEAGWGVAQVVVEGLKRTEGELTWDKYIEVMETFDKWADSTYTPITFSKNNHYGVTSMYITQAQDNKIEEITGLITFNPETGEITNAE